MKPDLPSVVVLDVAFSGYGIIRSLHGFGIPIIGFCMADRSPESYTALCSKKIFFSDPATLLDKLLAVSEALPEKPVLFLTTDYYVEFFMRHKQVLESTFLINTPDAPTLELLLDKNKMAVFAAENDILIPHSYRIHGADELQQVLDHARFPVILKPYKRTEAWEASGFNKAYILASAPELDSLYEEIAAVETNVIVQEYIRGGDDHIYYCLCYFGRDGECLTSFTGRKIRQWPVGTGSTASTEGIDDVFLRDESIRILKKVNYSGLGSVEFKKDAVDGRYYMMEPTAGRTDQQEYAATVSGVNIPLAAYCHLTGVDLPPGVPPQHPVLYIDEIAEIQSAFAHIRKGELTLLSWLKSLRGKKVYRFLNRKDPAVFFIGIPAKIIRWVWLRISQASTANNPAS